MKPMPFSKRVLVVDDDAPIRLLVTRILERESFTVDGARDGQEAIEKLDGGDYGVVVLDLMMPRVNGFQVLETIRARWPHLLGSVIVTSAIGAAAEEMLSPVTNRVLPKPFSVHDLVQHATECQSHEIRNGSDQVSEHR
jgi:CheY-like chemotaxis protein